MAPSRRFKRRGAAAVEFACVAPLLFLLVLGLMEFGRLMMVQHCLTNAAREGARKAVLANATTSEVNSTINNYMSTAGIDGHTITTSPSPESANAGDAITVTISVPYGQVSWLSFLDLDEEVLGADFFSIGQLQSKTLRADVVMRKEANNN